MSNETDDFELPDDLTEDMVVLFVKPYSPEDSEYLARTGCGDKEMREVFERANAKDPDFVVFEDTVGVVKTLLGLGGYVIGDDLILLHGDMDDLKRAEAELKDRYTCLFETVGDFLNFAKDEENLLRIPANKPVIN